MNKKINTLQHSHMVGVQNGIWVMGLYRLASEEFDDKAQTDYRNIILEIHTVHLVHTSTLRNFTLRFYVLHTISL